MKNEEILESNVSNNMVDNTQNSSGIQQNQQTNTTRSKAVPTPPPLDAEHVKDDKKSQKAFLDQSNSEVKSIQDLLPEDATQLYAPKRTQVVSEDFNDTTKGIIADQKSNL